MLSPKGNGLRNDVIPPPPQFQSVNANFLFGIYFNLGATTTIQTARRACHRFLAKADGLLNDRQFPRELLTPRRK